MSKHFVIATFGGLDHFETYEAAEAAASRLANDNTTKAAAKGLVVYEAVSVVKTPVPKAEVTKL